MSPPSDTGGVLEVFVSAALIVGLGLAFAIFLARRRAKQTRKDGSVDSIRPLADQESGADNAGPTTLQVVVDSPHGSAEFELQADELESFDEMRQLVVDAVPEMFEDDDEVTVDYLNGRGRWTRVKLKTPLDVVKAAGTVRITTNAPKRVEHGRRRLK